MLAANQLSRGVRPTIQGPTKRSDISWQGMLQIHLRLRDSYVSSPDDHSSA